MQKNSFIPDSIKEDIAAYLHGDITSEQNKVLQEWINSDRANEQLLKQLREVWDITFISGKRQFNIDAAWTEIEHRLAPKQAIMNKPMKYEYSPYKTLYRKLKPVLKVAAMLIFAYILGIATMQLTKAPADTSKYVEISVPKGSRTFLTLDDGTTVWLNAGTRFVYPKNYGQENRNVKLFGEAYFEVAKNKKIPFVVNANGVNITALGTSFNVMAYEEDGLVETTLTEGLVQIELADGSTNSQPVILKPNQKIILKPDGSIIENPVVDEQKNDKSVAEQNMLYKEQQNVSVAQLTDTRPYTSWKDPKWVFKQQNLAELSTKLARRYDVTFVFADEQLKEYVVSGTLLDETLEQVLRSLQLTAPISYTINHKTVILKEDPYLEKKYQKLID